MKELPGDLTDSSASQAGSKGRAGHASSKAERVSPAKTRSGRTRTGKGEGKLCVRHTLHSFYAFPAVIDISEVTDVHFVLDC